MGDDRRIGDIQPFAEIAQGATTLVYKGYEPHLDRFVLLKVLKPEYCTDEATARAFEEEARLAARVQHPNVVTLYAHGREDRQVYLAAEYVDGMDLRRLTAERRLPIELVVYIVIEAAQGLGAAHAKDVLHRDIKPSNILVAYDGHVKLTDFGMASLTVSAGEEGREVRGTLAYLPPEQVLGEPPTPQADLFSLGATFFELLSGRPAFRADGVDAYLHAVLHQDPIVHLRSDPTVPSVLVDICGRLMAKDPAARYPDTESLVDDLVAARASLHMTAAGAALARYLGDPDAYRHRPPVEDDRALDDPAPDVSAPLLRPDRAPVPARRDRWGGGRWAIVGLALMLAAIVWWADAPGSLVREAGALRDAPPVAANDGPASPSPEAPATPGTNDPGADEPPEQSSPGLAPGEADGVPAGERQADSEPVRVDEPIVPRTGDGETEGVPAESEANPALPATSPAGRGTLQVRTEPWAVVYVDGDSLGLSGSEFSLPAGRHAVRLVNTTLAGRLDYETTITVSPEQATELTHSFWSEVGQLRLSISPWAEVFVNGNARGVVQGVSEPIILPPGVYTLVLQHPSGSHSQSVEVVAGETTSLSFPDLLDLIDRQR